MDKYIKKETAIKSLLNDCLGQVSYSREDAADCIFWLDTADVVPVVHGRWDNIPNTYILVASKDGSYSGNATTCSVCHEVNPNAYKTNYCPNCGAKMDGGTT